MKRRDFRHIASALAGVTGRLSPQTELARAQAIWPDVAGESVAKNAAPIALKDKTLTLACSSSVWAQELELMGPELVKRLQKLLTDGSMVRIRCTVSERVTGPQNGR